MFCSGAPSHDCAHLRPARNAENHDSAVYWKHDEQEVIGILASIAMKVAADFVNTIGGLTELMIFFKDELKYRQTLNSKSPSCKLPDGRYQELVLYLLLGLEGLPTEALEHLAGILQAPICVSAPQENPKTSKN